MMKNKGQGSLEYLLLIGGAVLVAVIVIALVLTSSTDAGTATNLTTAKALCVQKAGVNQSCNTLTVVVNSKTYNCSGTRDSGCSDTTVAP